MIIPMTTRSGRQRRYDHRLRDLVQRTGDLTIATDLGVPRSTARGWLRATPRVVVTLETADLTGPELRQEILKLRRRVEKLAALLRLALALLRASEFSLSTARLPEGEAKRRILSAIDRARGCIPLRAVLRFLQLSPSRFHTWRRRQTACALDDQPSVPARHRTDSRPPRSRRSAPWSCRLSTVTSPPGRSPSSHSGSAASQRRRRPGTVSSGSTGGDALESACTPRSRRWGSARRDLTSCGTSTPP
jgi:hypothetical protein